MLSACVRPPVQSCSDESSCLVVLALVQTALAGRKQVLIRCMQHLHKWLTESSMQYVPPMGHGGVTVQRETAWDGSWVGWVQRMHAQAASGCSARWADGRTMQYPSCFPHCTAHGGASGTDSLIINAAVGIPSHHDDCRHVCSAAHTLRGSLSRQDERSCQKVWPLQRMKGITGPIRAICAWAPGAGVLAYCAAARCWPCS